MPSSHYGSHEAVRTAFAMLGTAENVPLDYWRNRTFTWLTVPMQLLLAVGGEANTGHNPIPPHWEYCEAQGHEAENAEFGTKRPQSVALQIVGDDGTHCTAWAVCQEHLTMMGASWDRLASKPWTHQN